MSCTPVWFSSPNSEVRLLRVAEFQGVMSQFEHLLCETCSALSFFYTHCVSFFFTFWFCLELHFIFSNFGKKKKKRNLNIMLCDVVFHFLKAIERYNSLCICRCISCINNRLLTHSHAQPTDMMTGLPLNFVLLVIKHTVVQQANKQWPGVDCFTTLPATFTLSFKQSLLQHLHVWVSDIY